jgi:D-glycero-alpha-D-manno-heptose-7-phosphate kinase
MRTFYQNGKGAILSTTINKYVYVTVNPRFDDSIRISYSKTEEVESVGAVEHPLVRACLNYTGIQHGLEITSIADLPSKGTGLGSSSAFTVGLLHALYAHAGRYCDATQLSEAASHIEIDICREPIGKQDQYAAAFGGLNIIEFQADETVNVWPVTCERSIIEGLQRNLLIFYTGISRSARGVLQDQMTEIEINEDKRKSLGRMVDLVYVFRDELYKGNLDAIGEILHENWILKRSLSSRISTSEIDDWYERARMAGALGGKLLGAGAGGFLLFYAPHERHEAITHMLPNLRRIDFAFERMGSRVIFCH